jgi:carboxymethylenebutenolidase
MPLAFERALQLSEMKMGSTVTFKRADGVEISGYLADAGADSPAVVVIQEWWGSNDQIRGVADRLAAAGYTVLVPDLYRGKSTTLSEEAHHLMTNLNFGDAASQDVRGAVQFLKTSHAKVGVTGFCMGGALTVLAMTMVPEADAGCVWYGFPPLEYVDATKIKAPMIAHWAEQDAFFAIDQVAPLEEKLNAAKVNYTGYRYLAHHAFANETAVGSRRLAAIQYDAVWAQMAWDRTLRFFGKTLG